MVYYVKIAVKFDFFAVGGAAEAARSIQKGHRPENGISEDKSLTRKLNYA